MGDGPDDQDARIPKSVRRYYIAQQGVFADAGVHPPAGRSPIEWHAAVEAATTRHDEILRAVEASSTVDEALEGARQSAAETHGKLAVALEGDDTAATAALDDRDEATTARGAAAAAARDAGTALAARVAATLRGACSAGCQPKSNEGVRHRNQTRWS